jgi:hypothetical protein
MIDALSIISALLIIGFAVFIFLCVAFAFLLLWSISTRVLSYDQDVEEDDFESRDDESSETEGYENSAVARAPLNVTEISTVFTFPQHQRRSSFLQDFGTSLV